MHQKRRASVVAPMKRLVGGTVAAVLLATALTVTMGWNPLCSLYDMWDPMYYILGCWDGPPKPPDA
jgi:ABC-type nitrate/sulfonate/bicarbonate transport system permease component